MNDNRSNSQNEQETNKSKTTISNATAKGLIIVGTLLVCAAAIVGLIIAQFNIALMWIILVSGIVLVALFFGIAEIINLPEAIKSKL